MEMDVLNVDNKDEVFIPPNFEKQYTGSIEVYGLEREIDIRFLSYTSFVRKLFSGDINCVEYISSPFYKKPSIFLDECSRIFLSYSLPQPYFKYKVLKSLLGFLNPINRKKSKKFIIPEKVNQNNLIKIANLFYLLKYERYPLNPNMAIGLMRDHDGNGVELIDPTTPNYNSTEIMTSTLEDYKISLETEWKGDIQQQYLGDGARWYRRLLSQVYLK